VAKGTNPMTLPPCVLGEGELLTHEDVRRRLAALVVAVLERRLDPYSAQVCTSALRAAADVLELGELQDRVDELERRMEAEAAGRVLRGRA